MKHAYLIIAHQEFEILNYLLASLDDQRNNIFIHIDKKVNDVPKLSCSAAKLVVLEERIDVRWADVSQIEVELLLFKTAYHYAEHAYYHLLSGVDMPLRSQDYIHAFFEKHRGKEFVGFTQAEISKQLERKVKRFHLFPRHFRRENSFLGFTRRFLRSIFLKFQEVTGVYRNRAIDFKKGTNWVSVTHAFVGYLLTYEAQIMQTYQHTFCADEIFLHTLCWHSSFRDCIYDFQSEGRGSQRVIRWKDNQICDWKNGEFEELVNTSFIFARKFNSKNMELVRQVICYVTKVR